MSDASTPDRKRLKAAFFAAVGLSLVLHLVQPWGRYLLYPFSFLATWAHEMGHGLTALCLGGSFKELVLFSDLGGYAVHTATGFIRRPLVSMGGLLGPAVFGGGVIVFGARSERSARNTLLVLTALVALSLVIWVRPFFSVGFLTLGLIGLGLGLVAWLRNELLELFLTQLIGIQLCLGSLGSFDYMFTQYFPRDGQQVASDTQAIAENWLLPYWLWGALIAAASILILVAAFYVAWIRPERRAAAG